MTITNEMARRLQTDADTELDAIERAIRRASSRVFTYEAGDANDPAEAQRAKLDDLGAAELDALAGIGRVRRDLSDALRGIDALGARPAPTDAELERLGKIEPAINAQATSMKVDQLERALRSAIFEGDRLSAQAWARAAQAQLDRAHDAGARITPDQQHQLHQLLAEANQVGAPVDQRAALRTPLVELSARALGLEGEITTARQRRGIGFRFGQQSRTVRFPDRGPRYAGTTGYEAADALDRVTR